MIFFLSARSQLRLREVHHDLQDVVNLAIQITDIDFCVLEGLRTKDRQKELVKSGASKTMNSKHLTGHAVDLAAIIDNTVRWDWPLYISIAEAMRTAAIQLDTQLVWGGVWDKPLNDIKGPIENEVEAYIKRRKKLGKGLFSDGPHFEMARRK